MRTYAAACALLIGACGGSGGGTGDGGPIDAETADRGEPILPGEHPRIYLSSFADRIRLTTALSINRPSAIRFRDMVDDQLAGGDHYNYQPWFSALLGPLTAEPQYCADAVARTEAWVAGEEALIASGMAAEVSFDSYLYVGEHIANVALTYDWCFDSLTDNQRQRWLAYANQAVWNVWNHEQATWGGTSFPWSGWSVDNPSNNYYYSFLKATMLLGLAAHGEHPDADGWVTMFRETQIRDQLVPTFTSDLVGGGSREGTGYGVSMARLFELYDWWRASTGERIDDLTPHARESLVSFLHLTVPTLDRIAPVGDHARDSTAALFDYHRNYVQILAYLYRDDPVAPIAKWWLSHCSVPEMGQGFMYVYDFLYDDPSIPEAPNMDALYPAYYAPGTGQIYVRSSWATDATWLHLIAGPYTESHAHRDQGSFLIYKNEWLAYDQNILSHSGIRQEEELHNLVRIESGPATVAMQYDASAVLLALADEPAYTYAAIDVAPMYDGALLTRYEREVVFLKPDVIVTYDRVDAAGNAAWQINTPVQPLLTGGVVTITGDGGGTLTIERHGGVTATTSVVDWAATDADMNGGYRVDVRLDTLGDSRFFHVLYLDGAVNNLSLADSGTREGLELGFTAGGTATIRFERDIVGGDLEITDAGGSTIFSGELPTGVETFPILR
jgi:hypothetical protein